MKVEVSLKWCQISPSEQCEDILRQTLTLEVYREVECSRRNVVELYYPANH